MKIESVTPPKSRTPWPIYKGPVEITDRDEITDFLGKKLSISKKDFSFSADGKVDVEVNVDFAGMHIEQIPFKFGVVNGTFSANDSGLKTLKNFPDSVGWDLNISNNKIKSLEGFPKSVLKKIILSQNPITSLEHISKKCMVLSIKNCQNLKSLHNLHKQITQFYEPYGAFFAGKIIVGTEEECFIRDSILGVFLIPGFKSFDSVYSFKVGGPAKAFGPFEIVNKHMKNKTDDSIYECQEELINAGFEEYAKI